MLLSFLVMFVVIVIIIVAAAVLLVAGVVVVIIVDVQIKIGTHHDLDFSVGHLALSLKINGGQHILLFRILDL